MEQWRVIPGWEAFYKVSDQGRVASIDRYCRSAGNGLALRKGRFLLPVVKGGRYSVVTLADGNHNDHPVTAWARSKFRGRGEWAHNHVEEGHAPDIQTGPTPHTTEQRLSWANDCWRKRLLWQHPDGTLRRSPLHRKQFFIHDLVLLAFIGPKPAGLVACHYDDDKSNNALSNLRYGTPKENHADSKRNGRRQFGERHWCTKHTESRILGIRAASSCKAAAVEFGVTYAYAWQVRKRKSWTHI